MRALATGVDAVLGASVRQYRWKVELVDALGLGSGTLDVTECVRDGLTWEEPGDKRASRLSLTLMSYTDRFDPDSGADKNALAIGQVVRLYEGDANLDEADWVATFYGHIRGQTGFTVDRQGLVYEAQVTAYGRRATPRFLKQPFTSEVYGRGVEYAQVCLDIATNQMGLGADEIGDFPGGTGKVTQFEANSIVDMTPLEAIDKILETVGMVADFDGAGKLRAYSRDVRRAADLVLGSWDLVFRRSIDPAEIEVYNSVAVIGLDKNLTEVAEPEQVLARAVVPVGFWRPSHRVKVRWTQDNSLRAKDTQMKIITSVNQSLQFVSGSEDYDQSSDYDGLIRVSIDDFLLTLLTAIGIACSVLAAIPDIAPPFGGPTITVGKVLWGIGQYLLYMTLSVISSGQYEILGVPLISIFKEVTGIATESGVPEWALHQKEIRNDWCNTVEECTEVAKLELYWEVAQARPRQFDLSDDWRLQVGDILQTPDGFKYWVESLSKTIGRGAMPVLRVGCNKLPAGV